MSDKQDDQGESTVDAVKAMGWFYMVFKGSVESFDELLIGSELLGLTVEILETNNLAVLERRILGSVGVEKVDSCGIGGIPVGDKGKGLVRICSANSFFHCNNSGEGFPGVGQVVGGDLESFGRDEEEDIVMFAHDFDVGLIPCAYVIDGSLTGQVHAMAIEGGRSGIVQDGLIGDRDGEHGAEDESRLSCTEGERDIKSQDKAKDMGSIMDGS